MATDPAIMKALAAAARREEVDPMQLDGMDFRGIPPIQATPPQPVDLNPKKKR